MRRDISEKVVYMNSLYGKESEILQKVKESAPAKSYATQLSSFEGAMLSFFVKTMRPKVILELGTCVGYSAMWMAESLEEGGIIYSIENGKQNYEIAKRNIQEAGLQEKICVINDNALDFMQKTDIKPDLIFIDAKKNEYPQYLNLASKILQNGGLLIADNTMLFDNVYVQCESQRNNKRFLKMQKAMQEFNDRLSNVQFWKTIMIPTDSGLTVALKQF